MWKQLDLFFFYVLSFASFMRIDRPWLVLLQWHLEQVLGSGVKRINTYAVDYDSELIKNDIFLL